ncbi:acyltransferase [Eisenbergiella sp.]
MKEKRLYIEMLRIIAVILVIFNHTDGYYYYFSETNNSLTYFFSIVMSVLCKINVPIFFMLTGAVLLEREESLAKLLKNRVIRIVAILIVFSLFYYIVDIVRYDEKNFSLQIFCEGLLAGTIQESFWYLYAYLGILFLLPFLRRAANNLTNREFQYLIVLQVILSVVLPFITAISGVPFYGIINLLNIYIFYVLCGFYFEKRFCDEALEKNIYKIICISVFCIMLSCAVIIITYNKYGSYQQQYITIFTPLLAQSVFLIVKWLFNKYQFSRNIRKIILYIGSCTFGVYLMEQFARIQLLPIYLYLCDHTFGVFACLTYVVLSFCVAIVYTVILKRIPGIRRLL